MHSAVAKILQTSVHCTKNKDSVKLLSGCARNYSYTAGVVFCHNYSMQRPFALIHDPSEHARAHTHTHTRIHTHTVSLLALEGGGNVTRLCRFANYLRSILPHTDGA